MDKLIITDWILIAAFVIMSIVAVIATCRDKIAAKAKARRTPEATLMLIGLFFGAAAEYVTMLIIRHKTKHAKFMIGLPIFIILHAALIAAYLIWLRPMLTA